MSPTARELARKAEHLKFFSAYADLEALIDAIPNGPPNSPEDELSLFIRDALIDARLMADRVAESLAKREVAAQREAA